MHTIFAFITTVIWSIVSIKIFHYNPNFMEIAIFYVVTSIYFKDLDYKYE